jgi:PucR C-terminal helix-turn-helix domain
MRRETEPWRALPSAVASMIEPELEAATEEILASIAREVPAYARPLEGSFGRGIRTGVSEALRQFVALIRDPDGGRAPGLEVYRALGAGELRQGRTLDSLQAAYRVGARVAWRRVAAAAQGARLDPQTLSLLAESIFAYIDQLAADSVEGYADAIAAQEGERFRRRRALAELLLSDPAVDEPGAQAAARAADWPWPRHAAALACREEELDHLRPRLPVDALVTTVGGLGCVVIADPRAPGRDRELRRTASGTTAALGPSRAPAQLASSWSLARAALNARESGLLAGDGLVLAEDHLGELLLGEAAEIVRAIARHRLAPLERLGKSARERMEATALGYVQHAGNAAAIGRALHLHPQTVRHRLRALRDLLGDQLDDPKARFELEAALLGRDRLRSGKSHHGLLAD